MSDHEAYATGFNYVPDCILRYRSSYTEGWCICKRLLCVHWDHTARECMVALESSSFMREKASLWLGPQIHSACFRRSALKGCVSWARLGVNLPSWLTMPMKRHSSETLVGGFNTLTAAVLSRSAWIPVSSSRCPRNLTVVLENSHFYGLRVAPADWILSSAVSKLMLCSAWVLPKICTSSIWHTTPFNLVRILFILFWKCSGALDIPK